MKPRAIKTLVVGALVASFVAGLAIAQQLSALNLTGNEVIQLEQGIGGSGIFTTTAVLRNSTGYVTVGGTGTVFTSMTTLQAKAIATSQITTWNVQFPPSAFDGEMVEVACPGSFTTTVSMVTLSPTTITGSAFTACNAGGAASGTGEWIYSLGLNTWLRIQ